MGVIIKEIKIPNSSYSFISDEGERGDFLENLSKINIFVGENNSGKSRLLRSMLFNSEDTLSPDFIPNSNDFTSISESISHLNDQISEYTDKWGFEWRNIRANKSNLEESFSKIYDFRFIRQHDNYIENIIELKAFFEALMSSIGDTTGSKGPGSTTGISTRALGSKFLEMYNIAFKDLKEIENINFNYNFSKIYIPILRGLRYISGNHEDVYFERTSQDYFKRSDGILLDDNALMNSYHLEVFTGLKAYKLVKKHLLGNLHQRKLIKEFENYLSKQFFNSEPIALIPKEEGNDQILTIKIGNEHEMPIYHLGDGIQSIIIITMPLFLREEEIQENENILVFIEEPEHMLHPSLQRKLIGTFFDKRFGNYQFFFTTHSNHFLDIAIDFEGISMFTVSKKLNGNKEEEIPEFSIKNVAFGDDNILNILGIRRSSVFLPNCNVWIEGFIDKRYFSHYLCVYQDYMKEKDPNFKMFQEDFHYSFYQYNGNDIVHSSLLDMDKLNKELDRFFVIKDRDDYDDNTKNKVNDKLKELLDDNFKILNCREVENLLKKEIILKIAENDRRCVDLDINRNFEYENYKNKRLGGFIDKVILNGEKIYGKNNGSLSNKEDFCKRAITNIKEWKDLSLEAQEITENIYKFIEKNNP